LWAILLLSRRESKTVFRRRVAAVADWSGIVVPELEQLDQFALGMTIAEVKELHGLDEIVKLSWNENLFGPLPGVLDAIHAELENIWLYTRAAVHRLPQRGRSRVGHESDQRRAGSRQPRAPRSRRQPAPAARSTTSSCPS
jgi:hypothetical protein